VFPAARIGDPVTHDMLVPSGLIGPMAPVPCPLCAGMPVLIEMLPAAHVGCTAVCSGATSLGPIHPPPVPPVPPPPIVKGSLTVMIHNMPAARWTPAPDFAACMVFLGDPKLMALRRVLIGDVGTGSAGAGGPGLAITPAQRKEIQDLLDAGDKQAALDKTVEVLKAAGLDFSVMKDGKPIYDSTMAGTYGTASREKNSTVKIGDAAFADAATLLTTVAHEHRHAEQWDDPPTATSMGSDARELESYFREIRNEDIFGVDQSMKDSNRKIAEKHYKKLTPAQKAKYKPQYEALIGPAPK